MSESEQNDRRLKLDRSSYPQDEILMLDELDELFKHWEHSWEHKVKTSDDDCVRDTGGSMTSDGFYPYYTHQPRKVLFVGRDAHGMWGRDYISSLHNVYRNTKQVWDGMSLNRHKFHSRMLYIAWGLRHDMPEWEDIPWADVIGDNFGVAEGVSFAFMNLCKVRGSTDSVYADFPMIDAFAKASLEPRNLIAEQISILKPEIVISMNLGERCQYFGELAIKESLPNVTVAELMANGHKSLLLDCWHFSAANKSSIQHFYHPICDAVRNHLLHDF